MVRFALKRPITILVLFISLLLFSIVAIRTIPIDIFPKLNSPTIYVIEQYGGMSAQQMEGFFSTRMQDQFLYINGIKNVESKNIQGLALVKLSFLRAFINFLCSSSVDLVMEPYVPGLGSSDLDSSLIFSS